MAKTKQPKKRDLEGEFLGYWRLVVPGAPVPVPEYHFAPPRRWRFDFAFPGHLVGIELEGGTFIQGRHTRGAGFQGDCEKYNAAALAGWRVLRYTAADLTQRPVQIIEEIVALLR